MKEAILYLEDGTSFIGRTLGTPGETAGEMVFNTAISDSQEILTDLSFAEGGNALLRMFTNDQNRLIINTFSGQASPVEAHQQG